MSPWARSDALLGEHEPQAAVHYLAGVNVDVGGHFHDGGGAAAQRLQRA